MTTSITTAEQMREAAAKATEPNTGDAWTTQEFEAGRRIKAAILAIPIADPVLPDDVAGMVQSLKARSAYTGDDNDLAATMITRQAQEIAEAHRYLRNLLKAFVAEHSPDNINWKPLPDLLGMLTQMDNASTVARDCKTQVTALQGEVERLKTYNARLIDENLELFNAKETVRAEGIEAGRIAERAACAEVAEGCGDTWSGTRYAEDAAREAAVDAKAEEIAAAIRARSNTHD